jgi:hypothetical protein
MTTSVGVTIYGSRDDGSVLHITPHPGGDVMIQVFAGDKSTIAMMVDARTLMRACGVALDETMKLGDWEDARQKPQPKKEALSDTF